jgi:hypothetical protein
MGTTTNDSIKLQWRPITSGMDMRFSFVRIQTPFRQIERQPLEEFTLAALSDDPLQPKKY